MTGPGITVWPEETCLLSELKKELIRSSIPSELSRKLIIMPTQRLATCLTGMLAEYYGAFFPPAIQTWESFLAEQFPVLVASDGAVRAEMSDQAMGLILASLIKEGSYRHIHQGHSHELKQFFSDLEEFGMGDQELAALAEKLRSDHYRDPGHIEHLLDRIGEIRRLLGSLAAAMESSGFVSRLGALKMRAGRLALYWADPKDIPYREVYFAGFTTVRSFFKPVLKQLSGLEKIRLWFVEAPKVLSQVSPLRELTEGLKDPQTPFQRLKKRPGCSKNGGDPGKKIAARIGIHSCGSWIDEVAHALHLADNYIRQGCPPSQIAILLTNEGRYGKVIRTLIQDLKKDANIAVATPLSQNLAGSWILSMPGYFSSNGSQELHLFQAFLTHKLTLNLLGKPFAGDAASVSGDICQMLAGKLISAIRDTEGCTGDPGRLADFVDDGLLSEGLKKLGLLLEPLWGFCRPESSGRQKRQSLKAWARLTEGILEKAGIWSLNEGQDPGLSGSGIQSLAGLMDSFQGAASVSNPLLTIGEFSALLKEKIQGTETRSIGYPLKGLQILGLTEARFVPFQVVMILGCIEGEFPRGLPKDLLMDEWLKGQLGLPGWQYVESLEDTTFQLLQSRIPRMELLYPREQNNIPAVRSRFIEKLCHRYPSLKVQYSGDEGFRHIFSGEKEADSGKSPLVPKILVSRPEKLLAQIDSGLLESLIHCPFRFALDRLFGKNHGRFSEPLAVREGKLLHKVLEVFFRGGRVGAFSIEKLPGRVAAPCWQQLAVERFCRIMAAVFPREPELAPLRCHMRDFAWPELAKSLNSWFQSGDQSELIFPSLWLCEWSLGQGEGVLVNTQELFGWADSAAQEQLPHILIKGIVDRVDMTQGRVVVSDYKRRRVPSGAQVLQALKPQLPLYLAGLRADKVHGFEIAHLPATLVYWNILEGRIIPACIPCQGAERKSGTRKFGAVPTEEALDNLRKAWGERALGLVGRGEAAVPEPGDICRHCNWDGVCRKYEPGTATRLRQLAEEKIARKTKNPAGGDHGL